MDNSAVMCDEVIESYYEETKQFQQILKNKIELVKHKISILYFTYIFINYYSIIDSC